MGKKRENETDTLGPFEVENQMDKQMEDETDFTRMNWV